MDAFRRKGSDPALQPTASFETELRADLESAPTAKVKEKGLSWIVLEDEKGTIRYELSGTPPYATLQRMAPDESPSLRIERVAFLRFDASDANDWFLPDQPSPAELARIEKIRVDIGIHEAAETPEYYVNDKINGIDLDGNPTNGTARIKSRRFGLILRH